MNLSSVPRALKRMFSQPPDLDEVWRDINEKIARLFGRGKKRPDDSQQHHFGRQPPGSGNDDSGGAFSGSSKFGKPLVVVVVIGALVWLATGFYVVQEGQQAIVMRFGKFKGAEAGGITGAGVNWRLPYPFESDEVVQSSQLRSVEIGRIRSNASGAGGTASSNSGNTRDSTMLTQDENIVDVRFVVQYRLKNSADYVFNNRDPDEAVVLAAESAVREVVGKGTMNTVLNEKREAIASDIVKSIQAQMDLYKTGVLISSVNIQNVQPPEQVQAAFDDALKAGQDGDRAKNEGQAYANDVLPRAEGAAARLREEAQGYKASVVAQAEGDASRFKAILPEYQRAPQLMRERLYTDTMRQIYSNVTKVMLDSRQSSPLLYLPLDKLLQTVAAGDASTNPAATSTPANNNSIAPSSPSANTSTGAASSGPRTRERDVR